MLQGGEIIIIILVALVVLGPERLPDLARRAGRWSVELRRAARDLRTGLESEVGDLRDLRRDIEGPVKEVRQELRNASRDIDDATREARGMKWVGPEPASGPSPSDALADLDDIESSQPESRDPGDQTDEGGDPNR